MPWRNDIPIHPAADLFPLLGEADLRALGQDIVKNGLTCPIETTLVKNGPQLIDGRNRLDAMELAGLRVKLEKTSTGAWKLLAEEEINGKWCGKPIAGKAGATVTIVSANVAEYIASVNVHRRHLTTEQKRDVIAALVKEDPTRSCRAIAAHAAVSKNTVAAVKKELEGRGQIDHVEHVVDTRGRLQPTSKSKVEKVPAPNTTQPATTEQQQPVVTAPPMAPEELRAAVTEAAEHALRGGHSSRRNFKNPNYVPPSKAGAAWMHLYGTARSFVEWATEENVKLAMDGMIESGRTYDQGANVDVVAKFAEMAAMIAGDTKTYADKRKMEREEKKTQQMRSAELRREFLEQKKAQHADKAKADSPTIVPDTPSATEIAAPPAAPTCRAEELAAQVQQAVTEGNIPGFLRHQGQEQAKAATTTGDEDTDTAKAEAT